MKTILNNIGNKSIYFLFMAGISSIISISVATPSLPPTIIAWEKGGKNRDIIKILYEATKPHKNEIIKPLYSMECLYTLGNIRNNIIITPLTGGLSGTSLFKIDLKNKSYVFRILRSSLSIEEKIQQVNAQSIASEKGWGPKLYTSDIEDGWILMQYLHTTPLTDEYRANDEMYIQLAKLLQKIQTGPPFLEGESRFTKIEKLLEELNNKGKIPAIFDYTTLKNILLSTKKNYQSTITPTHRDLNPNNLIFIKNQFFAIDFDDACQDDPLYDVATIGIFYIFNPHHEEIFLNSYFQHTPTKNELAHYHRMKQLNFLFYSLIFLKILSKQNTQNISFAIEPYEKLLQKLGQGELDVSSPEGQLTLAVSFLQQAINENSASKN